MQESVRGKCISVKYHKVLKQRFLDQKLQNVSKNYDGFRLFFQVNTDIDVIEELISNCSNNFNFLKNEDRHVPLGALIIHAVHDQAEF